MNLLRCILLSAILCIVQAVQAQTVTPWLTTASQSALLQAQSTVTFAVDPSPNAAYQTMDGFGFCLTEGSAEVMAAMNTTEQNALLQELFNPVSGVGISAIRIGIGASDLSSSSYSYNDIPSGTDVNLTQFSLAGPDLTYVVPLVKKILLINPDIKILGTAWSAPRWMKTNNAWIGGSLKPEYYSVYAHYFVKYLQAMEAEGIDLWAITIQNEPENPHNEPSMLMSSVEQTNFINNNLGPALATAGYNTKIIAFDHNCDNTAYPTEVCNQSPYVDGAGFHLYAGNISAMSTVYNATGKNVYFTEQYTGSGGSFAGDFGWHMENVMIGSCNNFAKAVFEWNLATNTSYGPRTPGGCTTCLGALTVSSATAFTRNVSYYVIAQFSKFVKPGAVRIPSTSTNASLKNVAFRNSDGSVVSVVYNASGSAINFKTDFNAQAFTYNIPASSAISFVWNNPGSVALPITSITAPENNAFVEVNALYTLTADATVSGTTISSVEFYDGVSLLGADASAPYSFDWTPTSIGKHTISCKAYDAASRVVTARIVNVQVFSYKNIPGKIEAEQYHNMLGFQTETCSDVDLGQNLGYTDSGDWLDYYVNAANPGFYRVEYRTAGQDQTGGIQLLDNAAAVLGALTFPPSGGWQTWTTNADTVYLNAGKQKLRLKSTAAGWNLNWINFTYPGPLNTTAASLLETSMQVYPNPHERNVEVRFLLAASDNIHIRLVNLLGEVVYASNTFLNAGQHTILLNTEMFPNGMYTLNLVSTDGSTAKTIVKQ